MQEIAWKINLISLFQQLLCKKVREGHHNPNANGWNEWTQMAYFSTSCKVSRSNTGLFLIIATSLGRATHSDGSKGYNLFHFFFGTWVYTRQQKILKRVTSIFTPMNDSSLFLSQISSEESFFELYIQKRTRYM